MRRWASPWSSSAQAGLERAVKFTNAVLRRFTLGELSERTPSEAGLAHSYPDWVAETWWREWGEEDALALMRAQNEPAETVVRLVRGEIEGEPTDIPGAYRVARVDEAGAGGGPRSGRRAAARSWPGLAVGSRDGERTLDLCAAPGREGDDARRRSGGASRSTPAARASWRRTCRRLGATNVSVVCADGLALPPELSGFDRALVDAPCSGLGILASRPDARWRAEPLPDLQLALLQAAAERVKAGGTITYSVCAINAAENEDVVDASGLEPDPLGTEWPAFRHPRRPEFLLTLPHVHRTSGFFIARLRVP